MASDSGSREHDVVVSTGRRGSWAGAGRGVPLRGGARGRPVALGGRSPEEFEAHARRDWAAAPRTGRSSSAHSADEAAVAAPGTLIVDVFAITAMQRSLPSDVLAPVLSALLHPGAGGGGALRARSPRSIASPPGLDASLWLAG